REFAGYRGGGFAAVRTGTEPRGGAARVVLQCEAERGEPAVPAGGRGAVGLERTVVGDSSGMGRDFGGASDRRGGIPGFACDAIAGQPLFPEFDGVPGGLFHGEPRPGRGVGGLGLAGGPTGHGRARLREASAVPGTPAGLDEWANKPRDDFQAGVSWRARRYRGDGAGSLGGIPLRVAEALR